MKLVPDIWPTRVALAADIKAPAQTVHAWWNRKDIPPRRDPEIIAAARARGITITFEQLVEMRSLGKSAFGEIREREVS